MFYKNYEIKEDVNDGGDHFCEIYFKEVFCGCIHVISGDKEEVLSETKDFIDQVLTLNKENNNEKV